MERLKIAVALLIAAAMLLSLTACGDKGPVSYTHLTLPTT